MSNTNGLEVTNVRFNEFKAGAMRAWASVTFNNVMTIDGFKIFEKDGRFWTNAPSDKKDDQYFDRVKFPKEWSQKGSKNPILDAITEAYEAQGSGSSTGGKTSSKKASPAVDATDQPW